MIDRRLKVTKRPDGTITMKGVAYEAGRPNVNGLVYPREVLEGALAKYLAQPERTLVLTLGCTAEAKPKLEDVIGIVTGVEFVGNELHVEAKLLKDNAFASLAAHYPDGLAFAGAGIGDMDEKTSTMREFTIRSIGLVKLSEVTGEEFS